jgi:predicted ribosome-associated RNA-binding protein Tma20
MVKFPEFLFGKKKSVPEDVQTRIKAALNANFEEDIISRLRAEIGASAELFQGRKIEIISSFPREMQSFLLLQPRIHNIYFVDKRPLLMEINEMVFPTLQGLRTHRFIERSVFVKEDAKVHITGVPQFNPRFGIAGPPIGQCNMERRDVYDVTQDVKANRPVQIVDKKSGEVLGVGIAMFDAGGIETGGSPIVEVVKVIHSRGDPLYWFTV